MTLSRSTVVAGGVGLLVLATVVLLWPAQRLTPAERVRRQVIQATRAAEEKDLGTLLDQVSPRFRMADGVDRDDLKRLLAAKLLPQRWIRVFLVDLSSVEANGGVEVSAKIIFGNSPAKSVQELAAHSSLEAYAIDARYEREPDGEWRAVSAQAHRLSPQDLISLSP